MFCTVSLIANVQDRQVDSSNTESSNSKNTALGSSDDKTDQEKVPPWCTISGQIVVQGKLPKRKLIDVSESKCGVMEIPNESILVDRNGGLKNVAFFLNSTKTKSQDPPIHPSFRSRPKNGVSVRVKNCTFQPRIIFVHPGEPMKLLNEDPIGHSFFLHASNSPQHSVFPTQKPVITKLKTAERLPSIFQCGTHTWMRGFVIARDEPYVAITDESGFLRIENMPIGEWEFRFWHEKSGYVKSLKGPTGELIEKRVFKLSVKNYQKIDLGKLVLDASELIE